MFWKLQLTCVLLASLFLSLTGCKVPKFDRLKPNQQFSYYKGAKIDNKIVFPPDSNKELLDWLIQPRQWKQSYATYAPVETVESEQVRVNLVKDTVVVSVRQTPDEVWEQFVTKKDTTIDDIFSRIRLAQAESEKTQEPSAP